MKWKQVPSFDNKLFRDDEIADEYLLACRYVSKASVGNRQFRMKEIAELPFCHQCKHYITIEKFLGKSLGGKQTWCERRFNAVPVKPDDFCSYAERREDGLPEEEPSCDMCFWDDKDVHYQCWDCARAHPDNYTEKGENDGSD